MAAVEDLASHAGLPAYHSALSPSLFRNRPTLLLPKCVIDCVIKTKERKEWIMDYELWVIGRFSLADSRIQISSPMLFALSMCKIETFKARKLRACNLPVHGSPDSRTLPGERTGCSLLWKPLHRLSDVLIKGVHTATSFRMPILVYCRKDPKTPTIRNLHHLSQPKTK